MWLQSYLALKSELCAQARTLIYRFPLSNPRPCEPVDKRHSTLTTSVSTVSTRTQHGAPNQTSRLEAVNEAHGG